MLKFFFLFIILTVIGFFYDKYKRKIVILEEQLNQTYIQKFLLTENTILSKHKPILWIHKKHKINTRKWDSFFSRSNTDLNQPYIHLCIRSIIKTCGNTFNICLVDDDSFSKVIPNWNISLDNLAEPIRSHMRMVAMAKLIYYYGGMILPKSTILLKDIYPLYIECINKYGCFVGEMNNRTSTSEYMNHFPNAKIMGCKRNCPMIKEFIKYLETLNLNDFSNESDFIGQSNRWLYKQYITKKFLFLENKV